MNIQEMTPEERVDYLYDRIDELLEQDEIRKAQIILQALMPADQAEIFSDLDEQEQRQVLRGLPYEAIADILEKVEDEEVAQVARWLPLDELADILDEMEPDEAADLLGDLGPDRAIQLLNKMTSFEGISPLLLHPDETAGGLMTSEYLALGQHMWAERAIAAIRQWAPEHEYLYYFVVDKEGKLIGVVSLLQILKADPKAELHEFMNRSFVSTTPEADQEICARLMSRYDLTALPVVDEEEHLLGVITIDDVIDVLEDEATEDIQRLGGANPLDKPYLLTSAWEVARSRIGWLLLLSVTGMFTTNVLEHFETTLEQESRAFVLHSYAHRHRRQRRIADHLDDHPRLGRRRDRAGRRPQSPLARDQDRPDAGAVSRRCRICACYDFQQRYSVRSDDWQRYGHHRLLGCGHQFPAAALRLPHRRRSRAHLRPADAHPGRRHGVVHLSDCSQVGLEFVRRLLHRAPRRWLKPSADIQGRRAVNYPSES